MSLSSVDIRARLAETEAEFPVPDWDNTRRLQRRWVLELLKPGGIGMEAGVFRGHFTDLICEIAKPRKLYLIDPWTTMGATFGWGKEYTSFGTLKTAIALEETRLRAALHPGVEAVIIEGMFPACAGQITDRLDWAYLDASHKYDETLRELTHLETMIRPDGVIAGDDWQPDPSNQHHGVFRAVNDFVARGNWTLIKAGPGLQWALGRKA